MGMIEIIICSYGSVILVKKAYNIQTYGMSFGYIM